MGPGKGAKRTRGAGWTGGRGRGRGGGRALPHHGPWFGKPRPAQSAAQRVSGRGVGGGGRLASGTAPAGPSRKRRRRCRGSPSGLRACHVGPGGGPARFRSQRAPRRLLPPAAVAAAAAAAAATARSRRCGRERGRSPRPADNDEPTGRGRRMLYGSAPTPPTSPH